MSGDMNDPDVAMEHEAAVVAEHAIALTGTPQKRIDDLQANRAQLLQEIAVHRRSSDGIRAQLDARGITGLTELLEFWDAGHPAK